MGLKNLQKTWNGLGDTDPLYAICLDPLKKGRKWHEQEFFLSGKKEAAAVIKGISWLVKDFPKKRALDFGCGVGRVTQGLCKYFDAVVGVDIAPSMIKLAGKYNKYGRKCTYTVNSRSDLSIFNDKFFSFIYSTQTLQHIPPEFTKIYIREFMRILSDQGILVFYLPSHPKVTLRGMIFKYVPNFILNIYRKMKYGGNIELYWVKKDEVLKILRSCAIDLQILAATKYETKDLVHCQYIVRKMK